MLKKKTKKHLRQNSNSVTSKDFIIEGIERIIIIIADGGRKIANRIVFNVSNFKRRRLIKVPINTPNKHTPEIKSTLVITAASSYSRCTENIDDA